MNIEKALSAPEENISAFVVQKDGRTVYEYYKDGCRGDSPFHVFSVTKSVVGLLLGIAIDEKLVGGVDCRVLDFFPGYVPKRGEKTLQRVALRDMLAMTAPFKYKSAPYTKHFTSMDWVKSSLDLLGGKGEIGEFRYTPVIGPDIFTGILRSATGMTPLDFAQARLFGPLGIDVPGNIDFKSKEEQFAFYKSRSMRGWVADPSGNNTGGWGLVLTPNDMVKIGRLALDRGMFGGKRVVSEKWIDESTAVHSRWKEIGAKFGYLWWVIDEGERAFAALGDGGNAIYVNRSKGLVVAAASYFKPKMYDRVRLIREVVEPAFG